MSSTSSALASLGLASSDAGYASRPHLDISHALKRLGERLGRVLHREPESEVVQFIRSRGGVLTDDLEREISRRYGNIVE